MEKMECENNEWEKSCGGYQNASEWKGLSLKWECYMKVFWFWLWCVEVKPWYGRGDREWESDRMRTERLKDLVGVSKGVDKVINENTVRCYGHLKRMLKSEKGG